MRCQCRLLHRSSGLQRASFTGQAGRSACEVRASPSWMRLPYRRTHDRRRRRMQDEQVVAGHYEDGRAACRSGLRPKEAPPVAARQAGARRRAGAAADIASACISRPLHDRKARRAEALDVLSLALGAPSTGRLNRRLVLDRQLAVSASAWYAGTALDDTSSASTPLPAQGVSLEELEKAVDESWRSCRRTLHRRRDQRARRGLVADRGLPARQPINRWRRNFRRGAGQRG